MKKQKALKYIPNRAHNTEKLKKKKNLGVGPCPESHVIYRVLPSLGVENPTLAKSIAPCIGP